MSRSSYDRLPITLEHRPPFAGCIAWPLVLTSVTCVAWVYSEFVDEVAGFPRIGTGTFGTVFQPVGVVLVHCAGVFTLAMLAFRLDRRINPWTIVTLDDAGVAWRREGRPGSTPHNELFGTYMALRPVHVYERNAGRMLPVRFKLVLVHWTDPTRNILLANTVTREECDEEAARLAALLPVPLLEPDTSDDPWRTHV